MIYKYRVDYTNEFKKKFKKLKKQGKNLDTFKYVIEQLANGYSLDTKFRDHKLFDNKHFNNCRECHIGPDWLLIYRIDNDNLILLLILTGSHSELF